MPAVVKVPPAAGLLAEQLPHLNTLRLDQATRRSLLCVQVFGPVCCSLTSLCQLGGKLVQHSIGFRIRTCTLQAFQAVTVRALCCTGSLRVLFAWILLKSQRGRHVSDR